LIAFPTDCPDQSKPHCLKVRVASKPAHWCTHFKVKDCHHMA